MRVPTGFLGGAIATHYRIGSPLFTRVLFGVYVAAIMDGACPAVPGSPFCDRDAKQHSAGDWPVTG